MEYPRISSITSHNHHHHDQENTSTMSTRGVRTHLPPEEPKSSVRELKWRVKRLAESSLAESSEGGGDQRGRLLKLAKLDTAFSPATPVAVQSTESSPVKTPITEVITDLDCQESGPKVGAESCRIFIRCLTQFFRHWMRSNL